MKRLRRKSFPHFFKILRKEDQEGSSDISSWGKIQFSPPLMTVDTESGQVVEEVKGRLTLDKQWAGKLNVQVGDIICHEEGFYKVISLHARCSHESFCRFDLLRLSNKGLLAEQQGEA